MDFGEENVPLLWGDQMNPTTMKKKPSSNTEEERANVLGNMERWQQQQQQQQPGAGPEPHRAPGDVPSHDQFTDIVPELPVYKVKQKANTLGAILYLILLVICAASIIASAILMPTAQNYLVKAITCSCNAVLLAIAGILQRHLVAEQHKEQRQGYIKFSKDLDRVIHLPFFIFSIGTAGLLLVAVWQPTEWENNLPPLFMIRVLMLLEIGVTIYVIGSYLRKVHRHHAVERHPDVMDSLYSALYPPASLASVRYNDGGLAEQQAMLLHYQQDNLRYLSEEILRLQETLSKFDRSHDGNPNTPQVDVVHLLSAREQELRAVTAERDQLLADIRLSRSVIGERDADIKQVQAINHQYIEENQRVRSMLDEWSSRTAKLELALEAERLTNLDFQKRLSLLRHQSSDAK
ncbi:unnamed protein product [Calypogeia fissa]